MTNPIHTKASRVLISALLLTVWGCGAVTSPTTPTTTTTSTSVTWASSFPAKGAVARQFTASKAGTVTVTLNTLSAVLGTVGLGIGVPQAGSAGCALTQEVD